MTESLNMDNQHCFKCNIVEGTTTTKFNGLGTYFYKDSVKLIWHHVSYDPEIIAACCKSCHREIHNRLRKEGKCTKTAKELQKLTNNSNTGKELLRKNHIKRKEIKG